MTDSPLQQYAALREAPPKRKLVGTLFLAVVIQVLLVSLTVFVVVFVPSQKEDPEFVAKKSIYLPQRELEHKMAVAEFQQAAQSPMQMEKIQVDRMTPTAMPQLPEMPSMEFTPVAPDTPSPVGAALFGNSGVGGMMQGLIGDASSISFLGIEENAARLIIVVDVSTSVFNAAESAGTSMEEVKRETRKLIEELNSNTLFNVILHRRTFLPMRDSLLPATMANKEFAIDWVTRKFPASGEQSISGARSASGGFQGIVPVLDLAFDMQPDVIFLVSDAGYFDETNNPVPFSKVLDLIRDRQKDLPEDARIHSIHFPDPRGIDDGRIGPKMRSIATRNGGKYRTFD